MPRPRLDPDTRPVLLGTQTVSRPYTDEYGADKGPRHPRPVRTRNGLPAPSYRYCGLGESMSEAEAAYWLTIRPTLNPV